MIKMVITRNSISVGYLLSGSNLTPLTCMQNARMQYLMTGFIGDIYTLKIGRHESVLGMSLSQFFQDIYNLCYTQDITFGTCILELMIKLNKQNKTPKAV